MTHLSLPHQSSVFDSQIKASVHVATRIETALRKGIQKRGQASLIVPGGRSPLAIFEKLRDSKIPWEKVSVTLTDERRVGLESPYSNYGQLLKYFSSGRGTVQGFVPLVLSADEEEIRKANKRLSRFPWPADMVVLGMGKDGHVASLFPGLRPDFPADSRVVATTAAHPPERVSLTPETLLDSSKIMLLVFGQEKREIFWKSLREEGCSLPFLLFLTQEKVPVEVVFSE